jgi:anthranilate synthase component I
MAPPVRPDEKVLTVITQTEFEQLAAQGHNRIPLSVKAFADLETQLSLYLKLAHTSAASPGANSFLLESVVGEERFGRYSFIALPARTLLRAAGFGTEAQTEVVTNGRVVETAYGKTLSRRCAAVSILRRVLHEGHTPRSL